MTNRNSKEEVTRDIDFITEIVEHTKDDPVAAREKLRDWQHELLTARIDIEREPKPIDEESKKAGARVAIKEAYEKINDQMDHLSTGDLAKINRILTNLFDENE